MEDIAPQPVMIAPMAERDDLMIAEPAEVSAYNAELARWEEATATIRDEIESLLKKAHEERRKFYLEKYESVITASYLKPADQRTPLEEQIARMVQWRLVRQFEEKPKTEKLSEPLSPAE